MRGARAARGMARPMRSASCWPLLALVVVAGCSAPGALVPPDAGPRASDAAPQADAALAPDARAEDAGADAPVVAPIPDALYAGARASCLVRDGEAWCWGAMPIGGMALAPVRVPELDGARQIALSFYDLCALAANGTVRCAGEARTGILGPGVSTEGRRETLAPVEGVTSAIALALGDTFACAVRDDGTVLCWGDDSVGQTGSPIPPHAPGSTVPQPTPQAVEGLTDAIGIAAGQYQACALRRDGHVACWGYDWYGALGRGPAYRGTPDSTPVDVVGLDDARAIAAMGATTCAVRAEGSVVCWGQALPEVDPESTDTCVVVADQECWRGPHALSAFDGVLGLHVGSGLVCATTVGAWSCAGDPTDGAVHGDGTPTGSVRALAVGQKHVCAIAPDASVVCRGRGTEGELGDGLGTSSATLVHVALP